MAFLTKVEEMRICQICHLQNKKKGKFPLCITLFSTKSCTIKLVTCKRLTIWLQEGNWNTVGPGDQNTSHSVPPSLHPTSITSLSWQILFDINHNAEDQVSVTMLIRDQQSISLVQSTRCIQHMSFWQKTELVIMMLLFSVSMPCKLIPAFWINIVYPSSGHPEDGDSMFFWNTGINTPVYLVWEPQISHKWITFAAVRTLIMQRLVAEN
jgi:hypothetical protein